MTDAVKELEKIAVDLGKWTHLPEDEQDPDHPYCVPLDVAGSAIRNLRAWIEKYGPFLERQQKAWAKVEAVAKALSDWRDIHGSGYSSIHYFAKRLRAAREAASHE